MDNTYAKLSIIHSTAADPEYIDAHKALTLARRAIEINTCSKSLEAIAAAYAIMGKYDLAAASMEQAVEAGENERQHPDTIESLRKMLSAYKSKAAK